MDLGGAQVALTEDVDLSRKEGNLLNLVVVAKKDPPPNPTPPNPNPNPNPTPTPNPNPNPKPNPNPNPNPSAGKVLFNISAQLTGLDFQAATNKGRRSKTFDLKFDAGKTYIIEMKQGSGSRINPFVQLLDSTGKVVGQDDDSGGGVNAKLEFTAPQAGLYRVVATTSAGLSLGSFTLTVTAKD